MSIILVKTGIHFFSFRDFHFCGSVTLCHTQG
jgi:hypothetical protein